MPTRSSTPPSIYSPTAIALVIWRGGFGVLAGVVTIGVLNMFIQYSLRFWRPIQDMSDKYNILQSAMAAGERIFKFLDTEPEIVRPLSPLPGDGSNRIEFRHVWFTYQKLTEEQQAAVEALKGHGFSRAVESPERIRALAVDAITLDVLMPKTDGWTVLGALKANPELRDIPVIMVTVAPDRGIGLSLGAAEVMTKPVDRAQLTALLRHLLSRDGPILLVEDDLATRDTLRSTIEKMGLTVAEATNGRLALSWLADNPAPALILLDLMMPEMDGFEFLDTFNSRADWRHVPVVVITAKQLTAAERGLLAVRTVIEKGDSIGRDIAAAIGKAVGRRPARADIEM